MPRYHIADNFGDDARAAQMFCRQILHTVLRLRRVGLVLCDEFVKGVVHENRFNLSDRFLDSFARAVINVTRAVRRRAVRAETVVTKSLLLALRVKRQIPNALCAFPVAQPIAYS